MNGRATSHFDTTLAPTHDNIPTTRYAAHNYDDVTSGDDVNDASPPTLMHPLPGVDVRDNASPTMSATLQDRAYALLGSSNGQTAPQAHRNLDHQAVLPGTNIHDTKLPTMMATLQDQAHALVEGPAAILRKDLNADSHELAHQVPEVRGAVQTAQPSSSNAGVVRDIGWHKANVEIPDPLIGGYTNGELFQFIRRFNKVGLPPSDHAIQGKNYLQD